MAFQLNTNMLSRGFGSQDSNVDGVFIASFNFILH